MPNTEREVNKEKERTLDEEKIKALSVKELMWRKFLRNKAAIICGIGIIVMYIVIMAGGFFAPYNMTEPHPDYLYAPPQIIHFMDSDGDFSFRPFVYRMEGKRNFKTFMMEYEEDKTQKDYLYFLVHGDKYELFGLFETDLHLFGVKEGTFFLLGTDLRGRDLLSRIIIGGRVTLTIGLLGVVMTVILGSVLGAVSGYFGGVIDNIIQRTIEFLRSFPTLPLWMALTAALPPNWPSTYVYFGIVTILSLIGWTGLAREVRGKVLAIRSSDYVSAALTSGARTPHIIFRHVIPNTLSHILVIGTLRIPIMIIGESSLSFLGLGIKPPMTSWGLLLKQAQKIEIIRLYPWMLMPGFFIIIAVLMINYFGDGIRDAADPFSN